MATKRKRRQKQTLREFKAWLEGIEELQPDGWAPNHEQWKLIRDRIGNILEESPPKPVVDTKKKEPLNQHVPIPSTLPPPAPITQGSIPPAAVDISPEAAQLLGKSPDGKIKVPDIDTSDGNIESPFV